MRNTRKQTVGWLWANLVGGIVAGMLEERLQFLGTLILVGLPLAVTQGLFLRHWLAFSWPRTLGWLAVVALGWPLGNLFLVNSAYYDVILRMTDRVPLIGGPLAFQALRVGTVMLLIGAMQLWFSHSDRLWWLLGSLAGGIVLALAQTLTCWSACAGLMTVGGPWLVGAVLGAVGWGLYALVTAPLLVGFTPFAAPSSSSRS